MTDGAVDALTPVEERIVDFYGDRVAAALVPAGEIYVPARPIAEALGLAWASQNNRIQRDEVLARRVRKVLMHGADGKAREMVCLPLELLAGWIFGVTTSKVRPELREKLTRYREECYRVLWEAFRDRVVAVPGAVLAESDAIAELRRIAEMGRAIARLADQQIELQRQQQHLSQRVDRAGQIVRVIQSDVATIQVRLEMLEDTVRPGAPIAKAQAAEISQRVKALAERLTGMEKQKNFYQGIFGELYRRFRVTSYTEIPQEQYAAVLAFLDDWGRAADSGSTAPPT
ncbi:MAG TPA: phage antirepressor N-terminal domain-containing protein [Burkholderiales bacterium]|nr:phage antirepressor N-terminal domain-containing protein [Burkholderiales bacterium]